ncbi:alpha/beta hydrolase [Nocardia sp. NPDC050793]|uniref:alpha/beta fold hydrolase n=1 Tax=Nocardia sp. NPDC050793 TaxID=3155159 RepID=UPI0033C76B95
MSVSEQLGREREIALSDCVIRYRERGSGRPVVFVHGLVANGDLWRNVVPGLADSGFRCIAPDWPLGSHRVPVPDQELTPPAMAALIAEFLERLDLDDVTMVANDTGGALTQLVMVEHPARIGRVVLTTCDVFDHFLPPPFHLLSTLLAIPGATWVVGRVMSTRALQRLPTVFGWVMKRPIPADIMESYVSHIRNDPAIRRDYRRFTRSIDNRYTREAAERLSQFTKPVLLLWGSEERLFPVHLAERLHTILPNSTLRLLDDTYVFIAEDRPTDLTDAIREFLAAEPPAQSR